MQTIQTQKKGCSEKINKIITFFKTQKKIILIAVAVVVVIILACVLANAIRNAVITKRVQSYLDGKMFVACHQEGGFLHDESWVCAFAFNGNEMGREFWSAYDQSSIGDIDEGIRYKYNPKRGSIFYKENGKWKEYSISIHLNDDGSVESMSEYIDPFDYGFGSEELREATVDEINILRKQTLCKHEYGQTVTIKKATCTNDGETSRTCTKCNYTVTEIVKKLDHDFDQSVTIKEATCTNNGETSHTCRVCGYTETQKTEKLEHKYKNKICTECGAKKPVQKAYDVEPNTWYVYDNILYFQNCKLINAVSVKGGQAMMVTYKPVCQHCQVIDDGTSMAGPEVDYEVKKIHYCDECGKQTLVWFKIG